MKTAFILIILVFSGLLVFVAVRDPGRNQASPPAPSPVMSFPAAAVLPSVVPQSELSDPKFLANGKWSLDQIRQDPAAIASQIRAEFSGGELLKNLLGIANFIKMNGTMDDLHSFMCILDNPSATKIMSRMLASMAKNKEDGLKLLGYSTAWTGQAEESEVKTALLRSAGKLVGMESIEALSQIEGAPLTTHEKAALLSGAVGADAGEVRKWVLDPSRNDLPQMELAGVFGQLAGVLPIATVFSDAASISNGDTPAFDQYVQTITVSASVGSLRDPVSTLNEVIGSGVLSDSQKESSTHTIVALWSSKDLMGAAAWANELSAGPVRDQAYLGVLNQVRNARLNIPEAENWANQISNEELRAFGLSLLHEPHKVD